MDKNPRSQPKVNILNTSTLHRLQSLIMPGAWIESTFWIRIQGCIFFPFPPPWGGGNFFKLLGKKIKWGRSDKKGREGEGKGQIHSNLPFPSQIESISNLYHLTDFLRPLIFIPFPSHSPSKKKKGVFRVFLVKMALKLQQLYLNFPKNLVQGGKPPLQPTPPLPNYVL